MNTSDSKGLGRGLDVIFHDLRQQESENHTSLVVELDLQKICPNPNQPRKFFDTESLQELTSSIKQDGVLQPILVRKTSDNVYQIIAGERRWRAAKLVKLLTIPALIVECDDKTALQFGLVENLQRDDLGAIETANAIKSLTDDFGKTVDEVAYMLSKSRSYVVNMTRLLKLPDSVQQLVSDKKITAGHARAILEAPNPEAIAQKIIQENLSVRAAENLARSMRHSAALLPIESMPDFKVLEQAFSDYFHVKVKIYLKQVGGVIQIYFSDFDELDYVVGRIS
ncbi:MAG: ParB/RepB/Spo0J family partition protein [Holosporales bacterium]|jgi:ParB family chromosome partitioning protein|nr:ParB/RepB/Spo0J family partition protein [Holosporales bacterium]